jgi:4'-phosphopantetheinyl transferase EntD
MAKRAKKRQPDWPAKLTRSLTLKDGTKLVTLADARAVMIRYFETVTHSVAIALAIELVMKAAETGAFQDRKAATDQVAIVLRWRAVY